VLLFPAHATAEYLVRRPVVGFLRWGEQHYVFKRIYDAVTWDGGRSGVYPLASLDIGIKSTVGLAMVDQSFLAPSNSLRAAVSASTQGVLSVGAQDRLSVFRDGTGTLSLGANYTERPDGVFYGLGADTRTSDKTFYSFVSRGIAMGLAGNLGGLHRAAVDVGYRDTRFGSSRISSDVPSLDQRYGGSGQPALPAGWGGYDLTWSRATLVIDTRSPSFESPATGLRLGSGASYGISPRDPGLQLVTWGADAGGFYDLTGAHHVLALLLAAHFTEKVADREVPFTELPPLGGVESMRGFLAGRLRGSSTLVGTLSYRYPVGNFLDGELFSSVGNAFPGHLDGFAVRRLFLNWGFGLRTTFTRDASFSLTLAFASNRFDASDFTPVDATRFSIGVIHGF
jgi:outer membrane protein assembly factor BamA